MRVQNDHSGAGSGRAKIAPMPLPADLSNVADIVPGIVAAASRRALELFRKQPHVDNKDKEGFDPVTAADKRVEEMLRDALNQRFPGHQVVGEEFGVVGDYDGVQWFIDPIDGTRAFISGSPMWGTLLGLVIEGRAVGGWMHQPFTGETWAACDGTGWHERNGKRSLLQTRIATTDLAMATLTATDPGVFLPNEWRAFQALADRVRLRRFGGDCYGYGLLALSCTDLVVEAGLNAYDIIPLIPIIEAAGGLVTNLDGEPPLTGGWAVAAASPEIHAAAIEVLQGALVD